MNKQLLNSLLLRIDNFPRSMEDTTMELLRKQEEESKKVLNKELELICGASIQEIDCVSEFSAELEKLVRDLVIGTDLEKSLAEIIEIERQIEREITSDAFLFARQVVMSVKALYHYKKKNWNKALAITLECNALNDYLVLQGVHSLAPRVFEQNRNMCSILLKEQKYDSAYSLLFNLFNYTFNGTSKNLYGDSFNHSDIWKRTKPLREAYIHQMFLVQLKDSVRFNFYEKENFLPTDWYLNLRFEENNATRKILSDWIRINRNLREQNHAEYFDRIVNFLSQSISLHYDILKISLLLDLIKLLQKFDCSEKHLLLDKISLYLHDKVQGHDRMRQIMIKKLQKRIGVAV